MEKRIKIVSNAGGLAPHKLAEAVAAIAEELGLEPKVAVVQGDDVMTQLDAWKEAGHLRNLDSHADLAPSDGMPMAANVYLGAAGIAAALEAGADIVLTGRTTDAAAVVGPGHVVARMGARPMGRPRRRAHSGPHRRMRVPSHRGKLQLLRRGRGLAAPRFSHRRDRRPRRERDLQAPWHRRPDLGGHRHRTAALRDRRPRLLLPGCDRALRHHSARAARARQGSCLRAPEASRPQTASSSACC